MMMNHVPAFEEVKRQKNLIVESIVKKLPFKLFSKHLTYAGGDSVLRIDSRIWGYVSGSCSFSEIFVPISM